MSLWGIGGLQSAQFIVGVRQDCTLTEAETDASWHSKYTCLYLLSTSLLWIKLLVATFRWEHEHESVSRSLAGLAISIVCVPQMTLPSRPEMSHVIVERRTSFTTDAGPTSPAWTVLWIPQRTASCEQNQSAYQQSHSTGKHLAFTSAMLQRVSLFQRHVVFRKTCWGGSVVQMEESSLHRIWVI